MTDKTLIPLELVDPNPYQTRIEYKPDEIASLAWSIAQDRLIQPPVYRFVDGRYQVGVGHKRTEAYKLLDSIQSTLLNGLHPELAKIVKASGVDYSKIPATVEVLSDEQMFRFVVTENSHRSDLSPIEEMLAMKRAKADFNYNSDQIGALFGKEGATVRGLMRLGDLPESIQILIHEGKLTQGAARFLLSLIKIAPERLDDVVEQILDGADAEEEVGDALRASSNVKQIYESTAPWKGKKIAVKHFPELTLAQAKKYCGVNPSTHQDNFVYENLVETIRKGKKPEDVGGFFGEEVNAKVVHLINPPTCDACPVSVTVDRSKYCGIKFCFERKQIAWGKSVLDKASKDAGIAIYNRETDGDKFIKMFARDAADLKTFADKDANLRLVYLTNESVYNNFDGIEDDHVHVILIGERAEKKIAAQQQQRRFEYGSVEYKEREKRRDAAKKALLQFAWTVAVPHFLPLVAGLTQVDFLERLIKEHDEPYKYDYKKITKESASTKKDKVVLIHKRLILASLFNDLQWDKEEKMLDSKTPVQKYAAHVQGLAKTWGVPLPKTFLSLAQDADANFTALVSVETKGAKK